MPRRKPSARELRRAFASDIAVTFTSPLSPRAWRDHIRDDIFAYGEPYGSGPRKRMCPVITRQALALIVGQGGRTPSGKQATVEHLVPRLVVRERLRELPWKQLDVTTAIPLVEAIMDRLTLTAIITSQQNAHLNSLKLASKMPAGWDPRTDCPLERYRRAGLLEDLVVIAPLEGELTPPMAALLAGFPRHPDLVITQG